MKAVVFHKPGEITCDAVYDPWIEMNHVSHPTTVIFQVVHVIQKALENLKHGKQINKSNAVNMDEFMRIVDLPYWGQIEEKFEGKSI
jgi:hypothetical protein